jgi:hypothetical protein
MVAVKRRSVKKKTQNLQKDTIMKRMLFNSPKLRKDHEANILTGQFVSQLMYCRSRLCTEDFEKVTTEMLELFSTYQKKISKLKKK